MNVVISGYYGYGNTGDELILRSLLNELKSINSKLNFVVLSGNPEDTLALHKVKAVDRYNLFKVIKTIYKSRVLISGGGGLLQDVTSKRSIIYYLVIILIAKILGKKVVIYSQGIGPINFWFNRILAGFVLKKVDLITVRDKESKNLIESFGVRKNVFIRFDPVVQLELHQYTESIKDNIAGIVVREVEDSRYMEVVASVADRIIKEKKFKVVFIPFQINSDLKIASDIKRRMKENSEILNIKRNNLWLDEIVKSISSLKLLIGMRLHSIILAVKFNIPFLAISYDPKIANFLSSINYNRIINIENMSGVNLFSEVDFVLSNRVKFNLIEKNSRNPEELKYYFT